MSAAVNSVGGEIVGHTTQLPETMLQQGIEIVNVREGGLIDCWVPFSVIDSTEVPVGEEYVESMSAQMGRIALSEGGSGQQTPIMLGLIEGESTLKIMDGFHRSKSLQIKGDDGLFATVKASDWNSLYDFRIFTAKDHRHVRFSRVVEWIREVWEYSDLADKLTVTQALSLYRFDTDGSKLGLDSSDVVSAKAWVKRKEEQWDMAAMTIHSHLKVAENVDPQLVHAARDKKDGKILTAPTQSILKTFANLIPNDFAMQNLVMGAAMQHNLQVPEVKALCNGVRACEDLEAATELVNGIDWENWQPEYGESKQRALRRAFDPRHKGASVLNGVAKEIASIDERITQSIERGEEITPKMVDKIFEAQAKARGLISELGKLTLRFNDLLEQGAEQAIETEQAIKAAEDALDDDDTAKNTTTPEKPQQPKTQEPTTATEATEKPPATLVPTASRQAQASVTKNTPTAGEARFNQRITDFLNGREDDMPNIITRTDISRAERLLLEGSFSGDPNLQDELREEIKNARATR